MTSKTAMDLFEVARTLKRKGRPEEQRICVRAAIRLQTFERRIKILHELSTGDKP